MATAAVTVAMLALALAALWFAAEAKDARVVAAALEADLKQARAGRDAAASAAADELARLRAERDMYVKRIHDAEDVIAMSSDPVARRHHLRELGKDLAGLGKPR